MHPNPNDHPTYHLASDDPSDPVFSDQDGWWFWDETWANAHGPFDDQKAARQELKIYASTL